MRHLKGMIAKPGKPVSIGGSLGRRESTGRGVAYLVSRAMDTTGIAANGATAARGQLESVNPVLIAANDRCATDNTGVQNAFGVITQVVEEREMAAWKARKSV